MNQQNILKALSICTKPADRTVPKSISDVDELLQKIGIHGRAEASDLIATLGATDVDQWDTALDRATTVMARRQFISDNHWHLKTALERRRTQAVQDALPQILKRIQPTVDMAIKDLISAAGQLPPGAAALDPEEVLNASADSAYHQARGALGVLTHAELVHRIPRRPGSKGISHGYRVVGLVTMPPTTEVELMHPLTQGLLNSEEVLATNTHVRDLLKAYHADPKQALLAVARQEHGPDITLNLAPTEQEVEARLDAVERAHLYKRVREHEAKV